MSKNINACLSHNTDNWRTPSKLYKAFIDNGFIDCFEFCSNYDQTKIDYNNRLLFINPPFSKMKIYVDWIIKQISNNNVVCLLIPSRTDTEYFHKLLDCKPFIIFIKGRLKYNDSNSAPFPSMLLVFNYISTFPFYFSLNEKELIDYIYSQRWSVL